MTYIVCLVQKGQQMIAKAKKTTQSQKHWQILSPIRQNMILALKLAQNFTIGASLVKTICLFDRYLIKFK